MVKEAFALGKVVGNETSCRDLYRLVATVRDLKMAILVSNDECSLKIRDTASWSRSETLFLKRLGDFVSIQDFAKFFPPFGGIGNV